MFLKIFFSLSRFYPRHQHYVAIISPHVSPNCERSAKVRYLWEIEVFISYFADCFLVGICHKLFSSSSFVFLSRRQCTKWFPPALWNHAGTAWHLIPDLGLEQLAQEGLAVFSMFQWIMHAPCPVSFLRRNHSEQPDWKTKNYSPSLHGQNSYINLECFCSII